MAQTTNNTNANNVVLNVTFGIYKRGIQAVDAVPANAAVLLYEHKGLDDNGNAVKVIDFLAVEGVKSTKTIDTIMPLLAVMVGEARKGADFDKKYRFVVNTNDVRSGIRNVTAYATWLSRTNVIWKTDSKGELTKAVTVGGGLKLSKTALKIKASQEIVKTPLAKIKPQLYQLAEAITEQATMFRDVLTEAGAVFDAAYATEVVEKSKTKKADKKQDKAA